MWIMMSTWIPLISRPMRRDMTRMGILLCLMQRIGGRLVGQ